MFFFSRKNLKYLLIVAILLIVIFASFRGMDNPIKGSIIGISSPFLKTFRIFAGGVKGFFDFLGSIGKMKNENEKIIKENQQLTAENIRLKDIEKENQELRRQLKLVPRNDYDLEACFVISQDPQGLGSYFIIDKGGKNGIQKGMPVIVSNGLLVGRITEAYSDTARITLITDPESAINAEVEDSGAKGIVRGEYGLGLKMDMISQTKEIKEGDAVITSGLGGEIPRGLAIGRVRQISQSPDKLFQLASLAPAVNFSDLRIVFVVKKF